MTKNPLSVKMRSKFNIELTTFPDGSDFTLLITKGSYEISSVLISCLKDMFLLFDLIICLYPLNLGRTIQ